MTEWDSWLKEYTGARVPNRLGTMYRRYGMNKEHTCGECTHLTKVQGHTKAYYKCGLYSLSSSETSDWRKKWIACGSWIKHIIFGGK